MVRGRQYWVLIYSFFSASKQQHMDLHLTLPCFFSFFHCWFFSFTSTLPKDFAVNMSISISNFHFHRHFHCEKMKILYYTMQVIVSLLPMILFVFQKTWFECFNSNWNSNLKQNMTRIFRVNGLVSWDMNMSSANLLKQENGTFSLFSKNRKISKWAF